MIGKQVHHFKIVSKIGEGGMGEVFLAEDTKLKRKVALKFLPPHISKDAEFKARFEHEATAAAALNHPNIVTVYELGEFEDRQFIAMEFIEGQGLDELIKAGDIKIERATKIALQIIEGLAAAHEAGIVHRDIKPGNIVIDQSGRVKILDFGLAKSRRATTETQAGTTVGTTQYESPEQGRGGNVDQRSDLFSVGVVLYEMIAGRLPFTGEFADAIRYAIANENPDPLARYKSDVPDEVQRIVSKLLEKDPDTRYPNAASVISDLKLLHRESGSQVTGVYEGAYKAPTKKSGLKKYLRPAELAVVVIALLLLFKPWQLTIEPSHDAVAAENRLAVMYFQNTADPEDSQRMGEIATNLLITDLSQSSGVQVVSSQRLYDLLAQTGHEGRGSISPGVATQVAKKANARWMLTGSILRMEPRILLTAQLVEVSSGDAVSSERINGAEGEDIFAIVDSLSARIRKGLAATGTEMSVPDRSAADVTTRSTDAYREYLEGMELQAKFFNSDALACFRRAIEFDSNFVMAYYRLVQYSSSSTAQKQEWLDKAASLASHVTRGERLRIEAMQALHSEDNRRAENLFRQIIENAPDDKDALKSMAVLMGQDYGSDSAVYYFEKVAEVDPLDKNAHNSLAYAYDKIGEFEKSIEAINRYLELAPDEPNPYDSRADLYAYNRRFDEAIESYRKALSIKPDYHASLEKLGNMYLFSGRYATAESCYTALIRKAVGFRRGEGRSRLATIAAYQGKIEEAIEILDDGMAADRMESASSASFAVFMKTLMKCLILAELPDFERGLTTAIKGQAMMKIMNPNDPDGFRSMVAWMEAELGHTQKAESILVEIQESYESLGRADDADLLETQGIIRFMMGQHEEALNLFQASEVKMGQPRLGYRYYISRVYLELGNPEEAVAHLEAMFKRYNNQWPVSPTIVAKGRYYLGVAYEQSGWNKKAIIEYQKFLELWKDADPGLIEVDDAKKRLAALQT